MARKRSLGFDLSVYLAVRCAVAALQTVPVAFALAIAEFLGWLAYRIDRRHREVAADNLRHAFPHAPPAEIDRLVRASFRHLCVMAVETIILMRRLNRATLNRYVIHNDPADRERFMAHLSSDRPVIVMTGHLGNWEVLSFGMALDGVRASVVARPLDNPFLDAFVTRFRTSTGQRILSKKGSLAVAEEVMRRGGNLGLVGDQDAGARGLYVDFFGRPASTYKSIALLSMQYDAPILVITTVRDGRPLAHRMYAEDEISPAEYAHDPNAVRKITERYTAALERGVRRHPEQYFWLHRRWKHQPKGRKGNRAA